MASNKFEPSTKLANAISLVMENDPKDWGAVEHMAMLRFLVLACSEQARAVIGEYKDQATGKVTKCLMLDGKPVEKITLPWATLREEFGQTGKLAECANCKKFLAEDYEQFRTAKERKAEYV